MTCDAGGICTNPVTVSCTPPLLWHTDRCECADGSLPAWNPGGPVCALPRTNIPTCTVTIAFTDPQAPQVTATSGCGDGIELAVAIALAKLLGG